MTFSAAAEALLDLDDRSRRVEGFRFDLLDSSNGDVGVLAVDRKRPPSVRNDATATNPRVINGLTILPRTRATDDSDFYFAQDVDTVAQRVRLVHVLGAGGTGYENEWGIFLFADDSNQVRSGGTSKACQLIDQTQITVQLLDESVAYPTGTNIGTALATQAAAAGIVSTEIEATTATLSAPLFGLAGRDSHDKIMRELCRAAGFLRPYFNNAGALVCRSTPNLETATADHTYGPGTGETGRALVDMIEESSGLLRAPNRYRVVDTSLRDVELVGTFDVADSAPHSFVNIGYRRTKSADVQGLADQDAADQSAKAEHAMDPSVFASTSFSSPIDSRHDTFDVVEWDGENHIEQEWATVLQRGAAMGHDVRRIYA